MKQNILKRTFTSLLIILMCFGMTGCSLPGLGGNAKNNAIVIAGGNTTERQILSEVISQMVKHYIKDEKTNIINNLGSTTLVFQTLKGGYSNVAGCMYTGTSLTGELQMPPTTDPQKAMKEVIEGYYKKHNMVWFPSYGFENTYAFMVRKDFAEKYNLKKISDLKNLSQKVKIGVDNSWIKREGDGYEGFKAKYGFDFKSIYPMDIGLVYKAVYNGDMDVVLGYSTDGRINAYNLVLLKDDLRLFPPYDASPLATVDALQKHPKLEEILLKLEGSIDSETMQKLNQESDGQKIEPNIVAKRFLEKNNYFEGKKVKPLKERDIYKKLMKSENKNSEENKKSVKNSNTKKTNSMDKKIAESYKKVRM